MNKKSEEEQSRRVALNAKSVLDLQKMKYNFAAQLIEDYNKGLRYIAKKELDAQIAEAEAIRKTVVAVEELRSQTAVKLSEHALGKKIYRLELDYARQIWQIENSRISAQEERRIGLARLYLMEQALLNRDMIQALMEEERQDAITQRKYFEVMGGVMKKAMEVVAKNKGKKLNIKATGPSGDFGVEGSFRIMAKDSAKKYRHLELPPLKQICDDVLSDIGKNSSKTPEARKSSDEPISVEGHCTVKVHYNPRDSGRIQIIRGGYDVDCYELNKEGICDMTERACPF